MAKSIKNKTINKSFDFILFTTVLILLSLGVTMVLSASSPSSLSLTGSSYTYVTKQFLAALIGIGAMWIASILDYKKYQKFYKIIYIASFVVLLLVLIPGIGRTINGARRWISIPIFTSVQPSEITKLGLIVFFAAYLTKNKNNLKSFKSGFLKPILFLLPIIAVLLIFQSHFSASIIISLVVATIMLMAGSRLRYFLTCGLTLAGALGTALYVMAEYFNKGAYRITRILSFLNPWADSQGSGWQIIQSLYAIGSGGIFGAGLRR